MLKINKLLQILTLFTLLLHCPAYAASVLDRITQWGSGTTSQNQPSAAVFRGGVTADNGITFATRFDTQQKLDVLADFQPAAEHQGKLAHLYLVAKHNNDWYMKNSKGEWRPWDYQLATLVPNTAEPKVLLALESLIVQTQLSNLAGEFQIFVGYQIDQRIHYNQVPLKFSVTLGEQPTDNAPVVPEPKNTAPLADAGSFKDINEGSQVTLDASNSRDPDGTIVSYHWEQTKGTSANLSNINSAKLSFIAPEVNRATDLQFKVTVTDNRGAIASSTVDVTVRDVSVIDPQVITEFVPNPVPTCNANQVLSNGVCETSIPVCVGSQVLQGGVCTTPNKVPTTNTQSVTVAKNGNIVIELSGNDADGDLLSFVIDTLPTRGNLSAVNGNQVTYVPAIGHDGADTFTFKVNDGKADSAPAIVNITITPSAEIPMARELIPEDKITLSTGQQVVRGEILITRADNATDEALRALIAEQGWKVVGYIPELAKYQVDIGTNTESELKSAIEKAKASPLVFIAIYNYVIESLSSYTNQVNDKLLEDEDKRWALNAINVQGAWEKIYVGKSIDELPGVSVGVIDSGFRNGHEDLNFQEILPSGTNEINLCKTSDSCEGANHGMHVAGIIAATGENGKGIAGVAYKNKISPIAYRVNSLEEVVAGLAVLVKKQVNVINLSLGSNFCRGNLGIFEQSICPDKKDISENGVKDYKKSFAHDVAELIRINNKLLFIEASGNSGEYKLNLNGKPTNEIVYSDYSELLATTLSSLYPIDIGYCGSLACIEDFDNDYQLLKGHVLIVGAYKERSNSLLITDYTQIPSESSIKQNYPFLLAPGGWGLDFFINPFNRFDVTSTLYSGNSYGGNAGTSMAAPHVTGVAALVWQTNPELTAEEVQKIILDSAKESLVSNYPALNAKRAVEKALETTKKEIITLGPSVAIQNDQTKFYIVGKNLTDDLDISFDACSSHTLLKGDKTQKEFQCTPESVGNYTLRVGDYITTVKVIGKYSDEDNDGLVNAWEVGKLYLDPFDPSDAAKDWDEDGTSNLQEFWDTISPRQVVTFPGDGQVDLVWNDSPYVGSYRVCLSTNTIINPDTCTPTIFVTGQNSYETLSKRRGTIIKNLTNRTSYNFVVQAFAAGHIEGSQQVTATPFSDGILQITSVLGGDSKVTLEWMGLATPSSYDVCYSTETLTNPLNCSLANKLLNQNSPTTITGLTNATPYYFSVIANTDEGSLASDVVTATPNCVAPKILYNGRCVSPLLAPAINLATPGDGSVELFWQASTDAIFHLVCYAPSAIDDPEHCSNAAHDTHLAYNQNSPTLVSGLINDQSYHFVVTAERGSEKISSPEITATPVNLALNTPPFNKTGTVVTDLGGYDVGVGMAIQKDGKILMSGSSRNSSLHTSSAIVRYNVDGTLDNSFDGDGIVLSDFGGDAYGIAIAVQSDGRIIVGGSVAGDYSLVRYNSDGSLDTSFGNGKVITDFGGNDSIERIVIQSDNKLLVLGSSGLARYNANGSLDDSFGIHGKLVPDFAKHFSFCLATQNDGKILVGGGFSDFVVGRYSENGTLDTTFGTGGKVTIDLGAEDYVADLLIQNGNQIVLTGWSGRSLNLVRLTNNGLIDNTFGNAGKIILSFDGYETLANRASLALQSDGKVLLGTHISTQFNSDFALARFNENGGLDNSFGNTGKIITDLGRYDAVFSLIVQQDGKIVLGGTSAFQSVSDFAIARYNIDGSLDNGQIKVRFTKISENGQNLDANASQWSCVRDNVSGLIWEIKTTNGLRSQNNNYSWYNPDNYTNGGNSGVQGSGTCSNVVCDTFSYIQAVNSQRLCGGANWRLPKIEELLSIVDNSHINPTIDTTYFPNTPLFSFVWTLSPYADNSYNDVWGVRFDNGKAFHDSKGNGYEVRLVRTP